MTFWTKCGYSALILTSGAKSILRSIGRWSGGQGTPHSSWIKVNNKIKVGIYLVGGMTKNQGRYERCPMDTLTILDFGDSLQDHKPTMKKPVLE